MSPWPVLQGVVSKRCVGTSAREAGAFLQQAYDFYTGATSGRGTRLSGILAPLTLAGESHAEEISGEFRRRVLELLEAGRAVTEIAAADLG